jgi:cytochrome c556
MTMRTAGWLVLAAVAIATPCVLAVDQQALPPDPPAPSSPTTPTSTPAPPLRRIGTMSELMVKIIYPYSDAIFYITTRTPTTQVEWNELQAKALMVAEAANLLMLPGRARDQDQWMADAKLMLDAGEAAFTAAKNKDVDALAALSEKLQESCVTCHRHYRPRYGRR